MAITVGQTTTASSGSAGDVTVNRPADLAVGNLLIGRAAITSSTASVTLPSGFTLLNDRDMGGVSGDATSVICYKVATAGDVAASNFTFTFGSGGGVFASMTRVILAKSAGIQGTGGATNGSVTITAPTITPAEADSLIMFFGTVQALNGTSGYALATDDISWTEAHDTQVDTGGSDMSLSMAYGIRPQTTATGSATATSQSADNIGQLVVISPAQSFSVSDTTTASDTISISRGLFITIAETVTLTESIVARVGMYIVNTAKNVASWFNTPKS